MKLIDVITKEEFTLYTVIPWGNPSLAVTPDGTKYLDRPTEGYRVESMLDIPLGRIYNLVTKYEDRYIRLITKIATPSVTYGYSWHGYLSYVVNNLEVLKYTNQEDNFAG